MPTPVVTRPSPSLLERFRVGQPVSTAQIRRWVQELNFLRAYNVQQAGAHHYLARTITAGNTANYPILYNRRDGIVGIRAQIAAHTGTDGNRYTAAFWLNGAFSANWNNGDNILLPSTRHRIATHHTINSGPGTSGVVVAEARIAAVEDVEGLRSFSLCEIPRATIDPLNDATEPGASEAWIDARNRVHTPSSPDTADGLRRLLYELDRARTQLRRCAQIATSEDRTFDTIQNTSIGYGPLNWQAHTGNPTFYMRPRRLYLSSTANSCTFYCRYYWSGGTNAKVRATATSLTTGTTATSVITLATAGAWTVQSAALNVPVDGVDQVCEITFDADSDGSVIDISNLAIFDTEA